MNIYLASLFALPASAFFALALHAPKRIVPAAAVGGLIGQYCFVLLQQQYGDYVAAFGATLVVCILSETASRFLKTPSTVISYPALTPLVPGVMLYRAMLAFSQADYNGGAVQLLCVLAYAGCMAIAITVSTIFAKRMLTPIFLKFSRKVPKP